MLDGVERLRCDTHSQSGDLLHMAGVFIEPKQTKVGNHYPADSVIPSNQYLSLLDPTCFSQSSPIRRP